MGENQFLYIVKVYRDARKADPSLPDIDPWEHLCIGSDYEGVINPLDIYFYANDLVRLQGTWEVVLLNAVNNPHPAFDKYREVIEVDRISELVTNILWTNSQTFLKQYF